MMRSVALAGVLIIILAASVTACETPASGEGYFYVVRNAAFIYDFSQDVPTVYGELLIEVTHTAPIKQICIMCSKQARGQGLQYAVIGGKALPKLQRLSDLDLQTATIDFESTYRQFIMPIAYTAPGEFFRVYLQVPIADLVEMSLAEGRLKSTAPRFLVPCDTVVVRVIPPTGRVFKPDAMTGPGMGNIGAYRLRGQLTVVDKADESIAHILYMNRKEDVRVPEAGYYIKLVEPAETIKIEGRLKSAQGERAGRLIPVMIVMAIGAVVFVIVWRLANVSAQRRAEESTKHVPI